MFSVENKYYLFFFNDAEAMDKSIHVTEKCPSDLKSIFVFLVDTVVV